MVPVILEWIRHVSLKLPATGKFTVKVLPFTKGGVVTHVEPSNVAGSDEKPGHPLRKNGRGWYTSKITWASLVGAAATLLSLFHINIAHLTGSVVDGTVALISAAVATYGRVAGTAQIGPKEARQARVAVNAQRPTALLRRPKSARSKSPDARCCSGRCPQRQDAK